jgi:hypothetical protein
LPKNLAYKYLLRHNIYCENMPTKTGEIATGKDHSDVVKDARADSLILLLESKKENADTRVMQEEKEFLYSIFRQASDVAGIVTGINAKPAENKFRAFCDAVVKKMRYVKEGLDVCRADIAAEDVAKPTNLIGLILASAGAGLITSSSLFGNSFVIGSAVLMGIPTGLCMVAMGALVVFGGIAVEILYHQIKDRL